MWRTLSTIFLHDATLPVHFQAPSHVNCSFFGAFDEDLFALHCIMAPVEYCAAAAAARILKHAQSTSCGGNGGGPLVSDFFCAD
jgi:hypothetical protein